MPNCIVGEIFPGMHCIWVPEETVASFGKQKRVIATVGKLQWHCAFNTELQFHLPEELEEVLATDPKAKKIFDSLTPGNKRGIIHIIAKVKSMDKRIEKSLLLAKRLRMGISSQKEIFKPIE